MKRKNMSILLALTLTASVLTACSASNGQPPSQAQEIAQTQETAQETGQAAESAQPAETAQGAEATQAADASGATVQGVQTGDSISADEAKSIALEHAGVAEGDLIAISITEERDDGMELYQVDFYTADKDYDYEIEKTSGQIMSIDTEINDLTWSTPSGAAFTKEQAIEAVLAKVSGATQDNLRMKAERDDGRTVYEGEVVVSDRKYEFEIDAQNGAFLEWNEKAFPAQASGQTAGGSAASSGSSAAQAADQTPENAALQTAMADAGVSQDTVLTVGVRQDRDDGQTRYDVKIYTANADYEYEIDETGTRILERERETYDLTWNTPSGAAFTKEQAIEAVLAKVSGATQENLRMKADRDDGRTVYEGEVILNDRKYEFKIDTGTGDFLEWSEERLFG